MTNPPALLRNKLFWVGLLYFAEGFPLGVFYEIFPVYFRQQGVELRQIGVLSLFGLAWTLKFLWAPAIDYWRHHRRWMAAVDVAMGAMMLFFAIHTGFGPTIWIAIGIFTALSATNDIAVDGYTIELLDKDELGIANGIRIGLYRVGMLASGFVLMASGAIGWSGAFAAAAVTFLVLAAACLAAPREKAIVSDRAPLSLELMALARSRFALASLGMFVLAIIWLADASANWSTRMPHFWVYAVQAALAVVLVVWLAGQWARVKRRRAREARERAGEAVPRSVQTLTPARDTTTHSGDTGTSHGFGAPRRRKPAKVEDALLRGPLFGALMELLRRPGIAPVLLFILIFKLPDAAMGFMVKPFWVDVGFSAAEIGLVSVNIGLALSIAGGVVGGWITDRIGIFRALWVLGLAQALSNLGYWFAALVLPIAKAGMMIPLEHKALLYGASAIESFTGGLGTAAFLAFLMAIVRKDRAATEYALLTSVFALSRSVSGWVGGLGAQSMGYASWFLLTVFLAAPAYVLLPWVKRMLAAEGAAPAEVTVARDVA